MCANSEYRFNAALGSRVASGEDAPTRAARERVQFGQVHKPLVEGRIDRTDRFHLGEALKDVVQGDRQVLTAPIRVRSPDPMNHDIIPIPHRDRLARIDLRTESVAVGRDLNVQQRLVKHPQVMNRGDGRTRRSPSHSVRSDHEVVERGESEPTDPKALDRAPPHSRCDGCR